MLPNCFLYLGTLKKTLKTSYPNANPSTLLKKMVGSLSREKEKGGDPTL